MNATVDTLFARWSEWIVTASLQAGVVALAVLAADLVLRRFAWPRLRLALHALVIVKLFVPPGLVGGFGVPGVADVGVAATLQIATAPSLPIAAFAGWLAVALVLLVGGALRSRCARRRVLAASDQAPRRVAELAAAVAAALGLRRTPGVFVNRGAAAAAVTAPIVFGGRDPFVVLPRDACAECSDDELVHVLLHEFAHVRRRDALAAALVWLGASLFWFHPLVALVARRMAGLRELGCDATVAAHLRGDPHRLRGYRATLLRAAASAVARSGPVGALGFGSSSTLIARLEWLERLARRRQRSRPRLELAATLLIVLIVGGVALPTARGAGRDDLFTRARATVDAALAGHRPPGCLTLHYSVLALSARSERTAPRSP